MQNITQHVPASLRLAGLPDPDRQEVAQLHAALYELQRLFILQNEELLALQLRVAALENP